MVQNRICIIWALPKGRAFRTRFLFVPHKRAQTNASIANAGLLKKNVIFLVASWFLKIKILNYVSLLFYLHYSVQKALIFQQMYLLALFFFQKIWDKNVFVFFKTKGEYWHKWNTCSAFPQCAINLFHVNIWLFRIFQLGNIVDLFKKYIKLRILDNAFIQTSKSWTWTSL